MTHTKDLQQKQARQVWSCAGQVRRARSQRKRASSRRAEAAGGHVSDQMVPARGDPQCSHRKYRKRQTVTRDRSAGGLRTQQASLKTPVRNLEDQSLVLGKRARTGLCRAPSPCSQSVAASGQKIMVPVPRTLGEAALLSLCLITMGTGVDGGQGKSLQATERFWF